MDSGAAGSWDRDELRRRLQSMDDFDFEHLVADLWERQGWTAEVEQQSSDAGVDVRATKSSPYEQKALIQAKRYSENNKLGGPDIQQYAALKQQEENVDKAIVVTTGRFTRSAEDRATDLNVKLIDGDDLLDLIEAHDAYDIVDEYLAATTIPENESPNTDSYDPGDSDLYLKPDEREELREMFGEDYQEHLKEQQYKATRAVEKARARVKLNPHDAAELGVFDGIDDADLERNWEENKMLAPLLKEDIHVDEDEGVFVGDLTDYVPAAAIPTDHNQGIVGIIERGVRDETWAKDSRTAKQLIKKAKKSDGESTGIAKRIESLAEGQENFHYVALGGLGLSIISFLLIPTGPDTSVTVFNTIGALLFVTMPFVGFAGLVLDLAYIRQQDTDWNPSYLLSLLGAIFAWLPYAVYYTYKRRKHIGL